MASKWKVSTAVCALTSALVLASVAFAATVVKGGSYSGGLIPARDGVVVSFKVSANGKQVTGLSTSNLPLYCSGGGPPIPIHFKSAAIFEQRDLLEHRHLPYSGGSQEGPGRGQAEDHGQVPQRRPGAGHARDQLRRLRQLQRQIALRD